MSAMWSTAKVDANFLGFHSLVYRVLGPTWSALLDNLDADVVDPKGQHYLGMRRAPAGKGNHHAYIGGLVQHMTEMWHHWVTLAPTLPQGTILEDAAVLRGIVCHDLHKAWCTFQIVEHSDKCPNGLDYGKHPSNFLMTNDQKSLYILMQSGIKLDMLDMNCLANSEGGWAESPPKWGTTLSKMVYLLDELSGNVEARAQAGNDIDLRKTDVYSALFEPDFGHKLCGVR